MAAGAFSIACGFFSLTASGLQLALGLVGAAMFGFFGLYAARQLLRRGPRLEFSPNGVTVSDMGIGLIPWKDVEHIQSFGSSEAPFIAFHVNDPRPYLDRMPPWARVLSSVHAKSGLPAFSVNLIGVDQDAAQIYRRALTLWQQGDWQSQTPANPDL